MANGFDRNRKYKTHEMLEWLCPGMSSKSAAVHTAFFANGTRVGVEWHDLVPGVFIANWHRGNLWLRLSPGYTLEVARAALLLAVS